MSIDKKAISNNFRLRGLDLVVLCYHEKAPWEICGAWDSMGTNGSIGFPSDGRPVAVCQHGRDHSIFVAHHDPKTFHPLQFGGELNWSKALKSERGRLS